MSIGNAPTISAFAGKASQIVTGTIQENLFINEVSFSTLWRFDMTASEVLNIVYDPTAFTGTQITFNPVGISATGGPVLIDYFAGITEDGNGTTIVTINRRTGSSITNQAVVRTNPTGLSTVGALNYFMSFAGSSRTVGGDSAGGSPVEIIPAIKYLLQLENTSNQSVVVSVDATWFEIP